MDKVIVTGLLVIGAITAAVVVITTMIPLISRSTGSAVESQQEAAKRIETSIEIIALAPSAAGNRIDVWVKNVGVATIDAIDKSDVFLIKQGVSATAMKYSSIAATKTWSGDLKEQGLSWSKGSTLQITITLLGADVLTAGEYLLRVSTPNAITADKIFSF